VKYSLTELNKTLARAQKEIPKNDPRRETTLTQLNGYKEKLEGYANNNSQDREVRTYAELALKSIFKANNLFDELRNKSNNPARR
jgi:ATP-dependent Clp protease ATP-binding subunit ClpA